jgi:hypothetical protein
LVAGCLAGVSLRAGYGVVLGSGFTFAIGNAGSFMPVMATQAMRGDASFLDVGMACVLSQVVAWGTGAAIGLAGLYLSAPRVYAWGVVGFVIGGFAGGLLLTIVIVSGHMPVFALLSPLIIAPSIGGGIVADRLRVAESSAV